ncbi:hypothetical protein JXC34_04790 [Candidatus Woesearchaeota archaeon]|nr:hypothetical protein [Candidatus Woesearchaeota archaeon]
MKYKSPSNVLFEKEIIKGYACKIRKGLRNQQYRLCLVLNEEGDSAPWISASFALYEVRNKELVLICKFSSEETLDNILINNNLDKSAAEALEILTKKSHKSSRHGEVSVSNLQDPPHYNQPED